MLDSVKNYLNLASGLTAVTRARAVTAARSLVSQGEATAGQVQTLAEELLSTSRNNREALVGLIRYETDRALGRVGLANTDEVAALRVRIRSLEATVRRLEARATTASATAQKRATKTATRAPAKTPAKTKTAAKSR